MVAVWSGTAPAEKDGADGGGGGTTSGLAAGSWKTLDLR